MPAASGRWVVSRRTGWRGFWGLAGVLVFAWATVAALLGAIAEPQVDSITLVLIVVPFLVMAVVLAFEGLGQGLVRLDADGYSTPLGRRRAWSDVLALGVGLVDGQRMPVVAVATRDDDLLAQDTFPGFAGDEADRLVAALRQAHPVPPGFEGLALGEQRWAGLTAEADRVEGVVEQACGRRPHTRTRAAYGYPGLETALVLDYGPNDAGEGVQLIVSPAGKGEGTDLALVASGRRWLRQNRKRSAPSEDEVADLFGEHTTTLVPAEAWGFDRLRVDVPGRRPVWFNAEEPDRFA